MNHHDTWGYAPVKPAKKSPVGLLLAIVLAAFLAGALVASYSFMSERFLTALTIHPDCPTAAC